jgi:hypothetical protein
VFYYVQNKHKLGGLVTIIKIPIQILAKKRDIQNKGCFSQSLEENSGIVLSYRRSRGSSVNIVSDYGLDDRGSIPGRGRGFFL